ncbi:MAG: GNAT family N-acetyltransferase [Myxococcota bacterium]
MPADPPPLTVRVVEGVGAVPAGEWDRLVAGAPPFLEHAFLASLEESGCVGAGTGWRPTVLTAREPGTEALVGAAPAYLKTHSMGEFVFDWAWADAAARSGIRYYPKLVIATPFTPAAGPRLLVDPALSAEQADGVRRALLAGALRVAEDVGAGGVHVLFCTERERDLAADMGFVARTGLQFHWRDEGYGSFDDFLARFRSKRRNQIRRERRRVSEAGVEVISRTGREVRDEDLPHAFRFYLSTVEKFLWGRQYLNERFFALLWERMRDRLQVVLARRGDEVVAGSVNFQKGAHRWGRYWGCDEEIPFLHFEVCAYAPIEDCIRQGVGVFEAGAGGGGHKLGRGFLPAFTWSAHHIGHEGLRDAVGEFCAREAEHLEEQAEDLRRSLFAHPPRGDGGDA